MNIQYDFHHVLNLCVCLNHFVFYSYKKKLNKLNKLDPKIA